MSALFSGVSSSLETSNTARTPRRPLLAGKSGSTIASCGYQQLGICVSRRRTRCKVTGIPCFLKLRSCLWCRYYAYVKVVSLFTRLSILNRVVYILIVQVSTLLCTIWYYPRVLLCNYTASTTTRVVDMPLPQVSSGLWGVYCLAMPRLMDPWKQFMEILHPRSAVCIRAYNLDVPI